MAVSKIPFSNCRDPHNRSKHKTCACGEHHLNDGDRQRKSKRRSRALRLARSLKQPTTK